MAAAVNGFLRPYLIIFFILGLIPCPYKMKSKTKKTYKIIGHRLVTALPTVFSLIINATIATIFTLYYSAKTLKFNSGNKNYIIAIIYVPTLLLTNISIIYRCMFLGNVHKKIVHNFSHNIFRCQNDENCNNQQQFDSMYKNVAQNIRLKFMAILGGQLLYIISNIYYEGEDENEGVTVLCLLMLQSVSYLTCLNVIVHVDVLTLMIIQWGPVSMMANKNMNRNINEGRQDFVVMACCTIDGGRIVFDENDLKVLKLVYFKLWKTVCLVNRYFGCCIVMLLIQFFVEATFASYWLCMLLLVARNWKISEFIRKFLFVCDVLSDTLIVFYIS